MERHHQINYIEIPTSNLLASKQFFSHVFAWQFTDYGPDYTAFSGQAVDGGFFSSPLQVRTEQGSALVVLYSDTLEDTLESVLAHGGSLHKAIFSFPGGRRFHFLDPSGNEFAVWSEQ